MEEDIEGAYHILDELLACKLGDEQHTDLVLKAFNIYLGQEDAERSKAMLDEIDTWTDASRAPLRKDCHRMYDIAIDKSSDHIDEMLTELESADDLTKGRLEYYLSLQYGNRGDAEKEEEYLRRSAEHSFKQD